MKLRRIFEYARRENNQEIGLNATPVDDPQAADDGGHQGPLDIEGERVAQSYPTAVRKILLHRNLRQAFWIRRPAPGPGLNFLGSRQRIPIGHPVFPAKETVR